MKFEQFTLDILEDIKPTLTNFIIPSVSNAQSIGVLDVLKKIQSACLSDSILAKEFNLIYLWGGASSGKTHLLLAMQGFFNHQELPSLYLAPNHQDWSLADMQSGPHSVAYLIDDVHLLNTSEMRQLFKLLIDQKNHPEKLILVSASQASLQLNIRDDVSSRLASGMNFELPRLSDTQKIQALQDFILAKGLNIHQDIPPWLLTHFQRDLPSLFSIIEALDHYSLQTKRAMTLPLLKELLKNQ